MLSKWLAKKNRRKEQGQVPPARLWTATALGRSVLSAEREALAGYLPGNASQTILELATLEMPGAGLANTIMLQAAMTSWRTPLIASLETLPLISRSVDVIIWRYLGLEWRARRRLLADAVRVLVPGGTLIVASLNPMDARVWRLAGVANIGLQGAGGIHTIARTLGMQIVQKSWHGSGRWRFRPLQISVLNKKNLGGTGQFYVPRRRRRVSQPAVALSRTGCLGP